MECVVIRIGRRARPAVMLGLVLGMLLSGLAFIWSRKEGIQNKAWFLKILIPAGLLPTAASIAGWLVAETGRWPWIVHGLQKIEDAVSPAVTAGNIIFLLVVFALLYGVLAVIGVSLMLKYGKSDPPAAEGKGA